MLTQPTRHQPASKMRSEMMTAAAGGLVRRDPAHLDSLFTKANPIFLISAPKLAVHQMVVPPLNQPWPTMPMGSGTAGA